MNETYEKEMSEQELLKELVGLQKKTNIKTTIAAIAAAVIALVMLISAIVLVPKVVSTVSAAEKFIGEAQESLGDLDTMITNTNKLLDDNTDAVTDAINQISKIDFESLGTSVEELSEIVGSLSSAFSIFR